jgi:hypothetical protein
LINRLLRGRCEICQRTGTVEVHQIRKLADLATAGPVQLMWEMIMANRRRKTLMVCDDCHGHIYASPAPLP